MRKIVFMMLLAVLSSSAAADWVRIGHNRIGTIYADPATIQRNGNMATMWDLVEYKAVQTVKGKSYRSTRTQYEYDCEQGKSRLLDMSAHSGNMASGEIVYRDPKARDWRPNQPNSAAAKLRKLACGN